MRQQVAHSIARVEERMAAVAASRGEEEAVHGLRTSIRRLNECLRTFEEVFPSGQAARVRQSSKKLMVLAAEVRNRDISGALFVKAGIAPGDPLHGRLQGEKLEWQSALAERIVRWTGRKQPDRWRRMLDER